MMEIGRYLLLIISLAGLTLNDNGRFSDEDVTRFLDYIFRLHNVVRLNHQAQPLIRTEDMNLLAFLKLFNLGNVNEEHLGENFISMPYNDTTQLNVAEAIKLFSLWYEKGNFFIYQPNYLSPYDNSYAFTQIVWQNTTNIGLIFSCKDKGSYNVQAVYSPRGNVPEQKQWNIFRPTLSQPVVDREIIYQTSKDRFLDYLFELHNEARTNHGVLPLKRDYDLDNYADSMYWQKIKTPTERYGVNIFTMMYDRNITLSDEIANEVFLKWYNTKKFYNYKVEPASTNTTDFDKFTQIVWKNTQKIGLTIHQKHFGVYEVMAVYKPPGNILGEYRKNVFRLRNKNQGESSGNN